MLWPSYYYYVLKAHDLFDTCSFACAHRSWALLDHIQMGCTQLQMKIDGIDSVAAHYLSKADKKN